MAKILDKKEQVFDLEVTPHGKYLLSVGEFEPVYYGFYDDNVLYDGEYAGITEAQSQIQQRIKEETVYLGTLTRQDSADDAVNTEAVNTEGPNNYFGTDFLPSLYQPQKTVLRNEIGDAYLEGDTNVAPAWKAVAMSGRINTITEKDTRNNIDIPQMNITMSYTLEAEEFDLVDAYARESVNSFVMTSKVFADGKVVSLKGDDLMVYLEENNTALLTENFDIEVFEIDEGAVSSEHGINIVPGEPSDAFLRKYFLRDYERVEGGLYTPQAVSNATVALNATFTTGSVRHYFDLMTDQQIDPVTACKSAELFNKNSYYIDLDFDCEDIVEPESGYVDIYGVVTEPEICQ
tara:strand:- start:2859 stop:3902 length:1044 start_codon:yes stop_codon:yes gene_type:complete